MRRKGVPSFDSVDLRKIFIVMTTRTSWRCYASNSSIAANQPPTPTLLMSGLDQSLWNGAKTCFKLATKPFLPRDLVAAVEDALRSDINKAAKIRARCR
jgi:hypothetical protein